jgi:hypothetical protein
MPLVNEGLTTSAPNSSEEKNKPHRAALTGVASSLPSTYPEASDIGRRVNLVPGPSGESFYGALVMSVPPAA